MEGEKEDSCKDCPIFASEGVLEFGATFAWRSSKLMSDVFCITQFSVTHTAVFSFKDISDVVLDSLWHVWSLLVLQSSKPACLSKASEEERTDLEG